MAGFVGIRDRIAIYQLPAIMKTTVTRLFFLPFTKWITDTDLFRFD